MTPENELSQVPPKARVSIAERLVPAMSFGLAALAGMGGAAMLLKHFNDLRSAELAGLSMLRQGMTTVESTALALLVFAAVVGFLGIVLCTARIFIDTKKASFGLLHLVVAVPAMVPAALVAYSCWRIVAEIAEPASINISAIAPLLSELCYAAIGIGVVALLILLVFSFTPISAKAGRKFSPLLSCLVAEGLVIAFAVVFFYLMMGTIEPGSPRQMDRGTPPVAG